MHSHFPFGDARNPKLALSGNESRGSPCSKWALGMVLVWTSGRNVSVLKIKTRDAGEGKEYILG